MMAEQLSGVILNVDDNGASLYAKSRVLRHAGFTVVEAPNGSTALRLAAESRPDLVLLDVHLPDMSGFEVCQRIKGAPNTANLLVLHISASFVETHHKTRGLEGGADGYLTEPVQPEELIATVRAFLRLRRTEAALRESEERLRVALEAGKMATWDWDIVHNRVTWSKQLEPMLGLAHGSFGGSYQAFLALVYAEDRRAVETAVALAIRQGSAYQTEFRMLHADGESRWVESRGQVYYDGNGRAVRMAGIHQDITERKQAATALEALNASLEQRVRERTAELERSNRELDQFAYVASHDLKAPLRGIDHLATWITEDVGALLPPPSLEHLAKLRGRVQRMDRLLDDLLAYSRVGRFDGGSEPVDTAALIKDIVALLAPPAGFTVIVADDLPTLLTPRAPLEVVLRNLIGNTCKHHPQPAAGVARISAQEQGDFIEFCVSDNGPGIDPRFHERIFGVFQTLQPRDQVEGSGMGLALVKKSVEHRGGQVRVASTPGQGATFWFTWPKG
jgi:PAS domain S-box-containing protein